MGGDADLRAGEPGSLEERLSGESDRRRMFKPEGEPELCSSVNPDGEAGRDVMLPVEVGTGGARDSDGICGGGAPSP